ncbi:hypothetical protein DXG01_005538 [Tephrocybe rancida]|nr:hypothetical protein DXG01_005538 [Tephrocybe rancida]
MPNERDDGDVVIAISTKFLWSLVFDYDNSGNDGEIVHAYSSTESRTYSSLSFNESVTSTAKKLAEKGFIDLDVGASYGPVSASVKTGYETSKEVNDMLQNTTRDQTEETTTYTKTVERSYRVAGRGRLCLYQRIYDGPGMNVREGAYRATPVPLTTDEMEQEVLVELVLAPKTFIKAIKVVYGNKEIDAPGDRIQQICGGSDDINFSYGGKYAWLVPEWTTKVSEALTRFDLVITSEEDSRYDDLAKGAGGKYRYLVPIKQAGESLFITKLYLSRSPVRAINTPIQPLGETSDINSGRRGDYLYLLWDLQRAYPV